jgi:hypothetical protein
MRRASGSLALKRMQPTSTGWPLPSTPAQTASQSSQGQAGVSVPAPAKQETADTQQLQLNFAHLLLAGWPWLDPPLVPCSCWTKCLKVQNARLIVSEADQQRQA